MRLIITITLLAFATASFASDDYKKVFEGRSGVGYVASKTSSSGVYTATTKFEKRSDRKKSKTVVFEDYVIDCNSSTYHTENTTTFYNGSEVSVFRSGEEEEIEDGFPLKLKAMYCGLSSTDQPLETCEKQTYYDSLDRNMAKLRNKRLGIIACE